MDQWPVSADPASGNSAQARPLCAYLPLQPERRDGGHTARHLLRPNKPSKFKPKTFIEHMTDYIDAVYVPQQKMMESQASE